MNGKQCMIIKDIYGEAVKNEHRNLEESKEEVFGDIRKFTGNRIKICKFYVKLMFLLKM